MFAQRRLYALNNKFGTANFVVSHFQPPPHFRHHLPFAPFRIVNCKPILFILKTYTAKLPRSGRKKKKLSNGNQHQQRKKANCATHSLSHSRAVSVSLRSLQNSYNLIKRLLHNFFESDFRFLVIRTSRRLNWMRFMLTYTQRARAHRERREDKMSGCEPNERGKKCIYRRLKVRDGREAQARKYQN